MMMADEIQKYKTGQQCKYKVKMRSVSAAIGSVKKKQILHILSV